MQVLLPGTLLEVRNITKVRKGGAGTHGWGSMHTDNASFAQAEDGLVYVECLEKKPSRVLLDFRHPAITVGADRGRQLRSSAFRV